MVFVSAFQQENGPVLGEVRGSFREMSLISHTSLLLFR